MIVLHCYSLGCETNYPTDFQRFFPNCRGNVGYGKARCILKLVWLENDSLQMPGDTSPRNRERVDGDVAMGKQRAIGNECERRGKIMTHKENCAEKAERELTVMWHWK